MMCNVNHFILLPLFFFLSLEEEKKERNMIVIFLILLFSVFILYQVFFSQREGFTPESSSPSTTTPVDYTGVSTPQAVTSTAPGSAAPGSAAPASAAPASTPLPPALEAALRSNLQPMPSLTSSSPGAGDPIAVEGISKQLSSVSADLSQLLADSKKA